MQLFTSTISFLLLFFLSRRLTTTLFQLFYLVTSSKRVSMHLLAWILLPGTAIHEFSHLVVATIVQVPTGKLTLTPEFDESGGIRAGSLKLAKSDPFRGTLIGLAPIIVGLSALGTLGYLFNLDFTNRHLQEVLLQMPLRSAILVMLLLEIGNTMFTSKSDLRDTVILGCLLLGVGLLLHGLGVQISLVLPQSFIGDIQGISQSLSIGLVGAVVVDIIVLAVIRMLVFVLRRLIN